MRRALYAICPRRTAATTDSGAPHQTNPVIATAKPAARAAAWSVGSPGGGKDPLGRTKSVIEQSLIAPHVVRPKEWPH